MGSYMRRTSRVMRAASTADDGRARRAPRRAARLGLALLPLVISIAACSVGSGGQTSPAPYNCVATTRGCVQNIRFHAAQGDLTGTPWAVSTSLLVSPMACDKACRASSGDPNNPGYIANFMQVVDTVHSYFIRVGYSTDSDGVSRYFYEYNLPEASFAHVWGDPTGINPGDQPVFRTFIMVSGGQVGICPQRTWSLAVFDNDSSTFQWLPQVACTKMVPDTWAFGQNVIGRSGATAKLAVFTNNLYDTNPTDYFGLNFHPTFLTHDGALANAFPLPYAGWTTLPSASQRGGFFYTECCQPVS